MRCQKFGGILVLLLVINLVSGFSIIDFFKAGYGITGNAVSSSICKDSDGGKQYYTLGSVSSLDSKGKLVKNSDYCSSSSKLIEYSCDSSNNLVKSEYSCSNGCKDGVCLSSKSSSSSPSVTSTTSKTSSNSSTTSSTTSSVSTTSVINNSKTSYCSGNFCTLYQGGGKIIVNGDSFELSFVGPTSARIVINDVSTLITEESSFSTSLTTLINFNVLYSSKENGISAVTFDWKPYNDSINSSSNSFCTDDACRIYEGDFLEINGDEVRLVSVSSSLLGTIRANFDFNGHSESIKEGKSYAADKNLYNTFVIFYSSKDDSKSYVEFNYVSIKSSLCTDTDGGEKYSKKGTVTGRDDRADDRNAITSSTDYCNGNTLNEYYCTYENKYYDYRDYICPYGCEDGACMDESPGDYSLCSGNDCKIYEGDTLRVNEVDDFELEIVNSNSVILISHGNKISLQAGASYSTDDTRITVTQIKYLTKDDSRSYVLFNWEDLNINPNPVNTLDTSSGLYVGKSLNISNRIIIDTTTTTPDRANIYIGDGTGWKLNFINRIKSTGVINKLFTITDKGNVGIGVPDPSAKLDVAGSIFSKGIFSIDMRDKDTKEAWGRDFMRFYPANGTESDGKGYYILSIQNNQVTFRTNENGNFGPANFYANNIKADGNINASGNVKAKSVTATTAEFGDVTVSGKVVAKKYCFPDGSCLDSASIKSK